MVLQQSLCFSSRRNNIYLSEVKNRYFLTFKLFSAMPANNQSFLFEQMLAYLMIHQSISKSLCNIRKFQVTNISKLGRFKAIDSHHTQYLQCQLQLMIFSWLNIDGLIFHFSLTKIILKTPFRNHQCQNVTSPTYRSKSSIGYVVLSDRTYFSQAT